MIIYFKIKQKRNGNKDINAVFQKIFPELMAKEKISTAVLDIENRKLTVKTLVEGKDNKGIRNRIVDMFFKNDLYVTLDLFKTRSKKNCKSENNKWVKMLRTSEHLHVIK